jgi:hypothetical protein
LRFSGESKAPRCELAVNFPHGRNAESGNE